MVAKIVAAAVLIAAVPVTARAKDGTKLVDDMRAVFGKHHARAVHAKGIVLIG